MIADWTFLIIVTIIYFVITAVLLSDDATHVYMYDMI